MASPSNNHAAPRINNSGQFAGDGNGCVFGGGLNKTNCSKEEAQKAANTGCKSGKRPEGTPRVTTKPLKAKEEAKKAANAGLDSKRQPKGGKNSTATPVQITAGQGNSTSPSNNHAAPGIYNSGQFAGDGNGCVFGGGLNKTNCSKEEAQKAANTALDSKEQPRGEKNSTATPVQTTSGQGNSSSPSNNHDAPRMINSGKFPGNGNGCVYGGDLNKTNYT